MIKARALIVLAVAFTPSIVLLAQSPVVQQLYAKAHADQEMGREEQAIADYRELLRTDPSIGPAYNNLGRLLYNLGRYPEAIKILQQGLAIAPDMAPANVMLGAAQFRMGALEEALTPLEAGVAALPEDRFAHITLAHVLSGLGRAADAIVQVNAILANSPKDQEAWYLLGKLHLELSQQAFTQVQAIDANAPLAHVMAGEIMESMENVPGAIDSYKQALTAAPGDTGALEHLADIYWKTGDWPRATEQLRAVLTKEPGNCVARWKLADTLREMGEPPDARAPEINRALELCPALPQAHAERARLLLQTGKPGQALSDLEVAEKAAPDEASLQYLYAQAYRALGDTQRAAAADRRFAQLEALEHAAKESHAARVMQSNQ